MMTKFINNDEYQERVNQIKMVEYYLSINDEYQERVNQIKMVEHYLSINDDIYLKNEDVKIRVYSEKVEYICGRYSDAIENICITTNRSASVFEFAMNIFKRFISSIEDKDIIKYYDENNGSMQISLIVFACSSLLISSKYDEVYPISINSIYNSLLKTNIKHPKSELNVFVIAESYILNSIKFELADLCKY